MTIQVWDKLEIHHHTSENLICSVKFRQGAFLWLVFTLVGHVWCNSVHLSSKCYCAVWATVEYIATRCHGSTGKRVSAVIFQIPLIAPCRNILQSLPFGSSAVQPVHRSRSPRGSKGGGKGVSPPPHIPQLTVHGIDIRHSFRGASPFGGLHDEDSSNHRLKTQSKNLAAARAPSWQQDAAAIFFNCACMQQPICHDFSPHSILSGIVVVVVNAAYV